MNDTEREELAVLAAARRAISPAAADSERVLAATLRALHAPAAAVSAEPLHAAERATGATGWLWGAQSRLARIAIALSIAGASGAIGYELGRRSVRSDVTPARRAQQGQAMPGLEPPLAPPGDPARRAPERASAADPAIGAQPATPVITDPAARGRSARHGRGEDGRATPAGGASPAAPSPAQSLELEIRALERVERALREREPRRALELLGELDRAVPGGKLQEERAAAFMMARCALGFGTPAVILRDFAKSHPQSVYFARVQQTCLGHAADAAAGRTGR
jgi:hypothetical protein